MFGLAGVAGAIIASSAAGRMADRGVGERITFMAIVLLVASWQAICLGRHSVLLLIAGIVFVDIGVFALQITKQSEIYRLRPDARSRLTSTYMSCFFIGGVIGSSVSAMAYARFGWSGVCVFGAGLGLIATIVWAVQKTRMICQGASLTRTTDCKRRKDCDLVKVKKPSLLEV